LGNCIVVGVAWVTSNRLVFSDARVPCVVRIITMISQLWVTSVIRVILVLLEL
jgi:hypothetical protein